MYVKKKRKEKKSSNFEGTKINPLSWLAKKKTLKIYPPQKKKKKNLDRNLESPGFQKQPSRARLDFRNEQFFTFKTQALIERQLMTEGDSEKWGESQKGENLKRKFLSNTIAKAWSLKLKTHKFFF